MGPMSGRKAFRSFILLLRLFFVRRLLVLIVRSCSRRLSGGVMIRFILVVRRFRVVTVAQRVVPLLLLRLFGIVRRLGVTWGSRVLMVPVTVATVIIT